ncbi:MAG: hypothetical protein ACPGYV_03510 [Phycisphaeraceae bacterium]
MDQPGARRAAAQSVARLAERPRADGNRRRDRLDQRAARSPTRHRPARAASARRVRRRRDDAGQGVDGFLTAVDEESLGPAEKRTLQLQEKIEQLEARREARNQRQGGGSVGPGPGGFDAPSERRDPLARQIERLREQIAKLSEQAQEEKENRERLATLRREREERRLAAQKLRGEREFPGLDGGGQFGGTNIEGIELKEGTTVRVWAADPTMRPGKTYRYKLLVSVINPLYAVKRLEPDQLADNQAKAAIMPTEDEIEDLDWIGPVNVEPESRFFFTSARDNSAKVEIYRRVYGELRKQAVDAAPGDRIGGSMEVPNPDGFGPPRVIDMSVDADIIDVTRRREVLINKPVNAMIYMDQKGRLYERIDDNDKNSADRKKLNRELEDGPEWKLRPETEATPGDRFDDGFGGGF